MMAGVLLSRLAGYARDALIAWLFGAGPATDAYYAAFTLPDLLNYMVAGGALSVAFLPIFARYLSEDREAEGWRVFSVVATTLGLLLVALLVPAWLLADRIVPLLFPGFPPETVALAVRLTRIVMPAQVAFVIGGVIASTLYAKERFLAPALAPLLYNLSIIAFGLALHRAVGIEGFAWGVLIGAFIGPLGLPLLAARSELRYRPALAPRDPGFLEFMKLALPLMIGFSLLTVDEWIGRYFGSAWPGTVTHLNNARRLMLVPIAVLGQAAGMATLPFLAKLHASGDEAERDRLLGLSLRSVAQVMVAAAGGLALLAVPAVRLVYGWGAYGAEDVGATATLLVFYCLGIPAWGMQAIAVRAFYAARDTLTPMIIATLITLAMLPIYGALAAAMGPAGLALASAIGITANAKATMWALSRRGIRPGLLGLAGTTARALVACAAGGGAGLFVVRLVGEALPATELGGALAAAVAGGGAYVAVVLLLAGPLRLEETAALLRRIKARYGGPKAKA